MGNFLPAFLTLFFVLSLNAVNANPLNEPDDDGDGVSNYDDYCPNTPRGRNVWTVKHFREGRAKLNWVGCSGSGDFAAAGYVPPSRPRAAAVPKEGTHAGSLYATFNAIDAKNPAPTFEELEKWWVGRCYTTYAPDTAMGVLLVTARSKEDGPRFPDRRFLTFFTSAKATYYDKITPAIVGAVQNFLQKQTFKDTITTVGSSLLHTWPTYSIELRKKDKFYYGIMRSLEGFNKGDVGASCYFFAPMSIEAPAIPPPPAAVTPPPPATTPPPAKVVPPPGKTTPPPPPETVVPPPPPVQK